jgi:Cytochrome C oxidase, cbb3-type, subunit III
MSAARSRTFRTAFTASLIGLVGIAACSGEVRPSPGSTTGSNPTGSAPTGSAPTGSGGSTGVAGSGNPDQVVGSGSAGTGAPTTGTGGTEVIGGTGAGGSGPPPNLDTCTGDLPGAYNTLCSGCHNQAGTANSRYPDLYKFMGTAAAFLMQVRNGGMQMAAYPTALITDADVMKIYSYFTAQAGKRPTLDAIDLGGVVPLFATTDAKNGPIVFTRDDGAIITRGAGRVRGRHEKEGSFGQFLENYMDNRTYGFVNEDFTNTATKHIRTTYEPVSTPDHDGNRITNWRHWKEQGDNATFMQNDYMKDMTMDAMPIPPTGTVAFVQQFDDMNPPGTRSFTMGDNFEFEFGIFILPTALATPGSRDSYYTDTFRLQIGVGGLTPYNMDFDNGAAPFHAMGPGPASRFGGNTTASWLRIEPYNYYGEMALNIQQ